MKSNPFRSLLCQMKPLSISTLIQKYVNLTPLVVGQNLSLNNINWKFNILIKYFTLLIENFLQL